MSDDHVTDDISKESENALREGCKIKVVEYIKQNSAWDALKEQPTDVLFEFASNLDVERNFPETND